MTKKRSRQNTPGQSNGAGAKPSQQKTPAQPNEPERELSQQKTTIPHNDTDAVTRRFEYDQLRKEILHNDVLSTQRVQFIIAASGASLAASSWIRNQPLVMLGVAIAFAFATDLSIRQEIERLRSTWTISSYMRIFLEGNDVAMWERRLSPFRQISREKAGIATRNPYIYAIINVFACVAMAISIARLFHFHHEATLWPFGLVVGLIWSSRLLIAYDRLMRAGGKYFEDIWLAIYAADDKKIKELEGKENVPTSLFGTVRRIHTRLALRQLPSTLNGTSNDTVSVRCRFCGHAGTINEKTCRTCRRPNFT